MAEYVMKHLLAQAGLSGRFEVSSAAVSGEEGSSGIYPPALRELRRHGVPAGGHRAHKVTRGEYLASDLVVVMDGSNLWYLDTYTSSDPLPSRTRMLMSFCGEDRDVADPWYTRDFGKAYDDIERGCRAILAQIQAGTLLA